jgi:hypothetical protein
MKNIKGGIYAEHGFIDRADYLLHLAEDYDVDVPTVYRLAETLGEEEDFDMLVTTLEDADAFREANEY